MKSTKIIFIFLFISIFATIVKAQDAIVIDSGNFVRGTIKGTNYSSVIILKDDQTVAEYKAKDIKEFLWNGETYISKPIINKKNMEFRFFKVIEMGAVNLYALGGSTGNSEPQPSRRRVRPSIGVGLGSGGFGGMGMGGGISIGGGRRQSEKDGNTASPAVYYIEKFGTGPLQFIATDGKTSDLNTTKIILLQKLTNDEDLAERIKATESFDAKNIKAFVSAYNSMHN